MSDKELAPVLECRQPAVIAENLMDVRDRVAVVTDMVNALPRCKDSLAEVKRSRAELRKYFDALETQRKIVKDAVMAPYNKAEAAYRELVANPITVADALCKGFVAEVEAMEKKRCEDELRGFFTELCQSKGISWIPFERVGIKVTMAMAGQKELRGPKEDIRQFVQRVENDLAAIAGMGDSTDLLMEYERSLDLAAAISAVEARKQARAAAEERRAQYQESKNAGAGAVQRVEQAAPEAVKVLYASQEKRFRVTFTITATLPMLRGLKAFLEINKYDYKEENGNG